MNGRALAWTACLLVVLAGFRSEGGAASDLDPRISTLLSSISDARLGAIVERLASFETRQTLSDDTPNRGIGTARQWILDEMKGYSPRLQVTFDTYRIPRQGRRVTREADVRNVMAVLPGRSPRRIYVSGHYDTIVLPAVSPAVDVEDQPPAPPGTPPFDSTAVNQPAPGANDDGSGTALTMELARVFAQSGIDFDATLVFIAFAGEEQGLVGALLHAQKAAAEKAPIEAVFNNDIVGNSRGGSGVIDAESVRVFSDGPEDSASRQIARYLARQGARYVPGHRVRLIARHDRFGRGGDHTAFNQHGFAAIRLTESNEDYSRQHTIGDAPEGVSPAYLAQNARVEAAAVAVLALGPPAPSLADKWNRPRLARQPSPNDARLRWSASPGAASYRVFWREAWTPDWQHEVNVGSVTEYVLPNVSIDDYVFGVAAVGPDGHESLVAVYVNPARPDETIEKVK